MLSRCRDMKNKYYGGRGVVVCEEWRNFLTFLHDMGQRPSAQHSIERIDNNGSYSKTNCRWAVARDQARNRRGNRLVTYGGTSRTVAEWAEMAGLKDTTLRNRLRSGWSFERAFTIPVQQRGT